MNKQVWALLAVALLALTLVACQATPTPTTAPTSAPTVTPPPTSTPAPTPVPTATPSPWVSETADSEGDVGQDSSLALDASGNPHIAYVDVRPLEPPACGQGVKYTYWTRSRWVIEGVDVVECEGSSLALDGSDVPHISYYNTANNDLKYAHRVAPHFGETLTRGTYALIALDP